MHKSNVSEGIHTSRNAENRHILIIGASLISALILLFLISTVFSPGGSDGEPGEALQVVASDSLDTLTVIEPDIMEEEMPRFWLQARANSTGDAGWGPDVIAPFDTMWQIRSNAGREFFSSPALVEGILYFGCNDGNLRAVDAASGSVKWTFGTVCGICGEPAVDSASVYFGGQDGVVYALDRMSGSKQWSAGLGYHVFCDTGILSDTLIVTGNSMGRVCALNSRTGEPVWDDEIGGIVLGPAIVDTLAVFSSEGGEVAVFTASGNQLWAKDYSSQASPPSADSTGVYAGFSNGVVRKFSLDDGHVIWETDIVSSSSRCVLARPVLTGNAVLAGTNDGQLVSLNASSGAVIWRQNFDNWLQLPPVAAQELVYISCDDQRLHIVELDTGAKVDSLEMDGYSGTAPLLADGVIYFGNTSGDFSALRGTFPEAETAEPVDEPVDGQADEQIDETSVDQTGEQTDEIPDGLTDEQIDEPVDDQTEVPADDSNGDSTDVPDDEPLDDQTEEQVNEPVDDQTEEQVMDNIMVQPLSETSQGEAGDTADSTETD